MSTTPKKLSKAYQFFAFVAFTLIIATIFLIAYYGTANWEAAATYMIMLAVWTVVLVVLGWSFGNKGALTFGYLANIAGWQVLIGVMVVPLLFFLEQASELFAGAHLELTNMIPQFLSHFFPISLFPITFAFLNTSVIPVWAQTVLWNFGDVAAAEEVFKVGAINLILFGIILKFRRLSNRTIFALGFGVLSLVNLLWTAMHGLLAYSETSQYLVAFVDGEVLLTLTWVLHSIWPALIGHALWNILTTFGMLTWLNMIVLALANGTLMFLLLYLKRRARPNTGVA